MTGLRQPLVTIAIPFTRVDRYLRGAVQSVLAQTYQNWELLLLADGVHGSELAQLPALGDRRVRLLSGSRRLGLPTKLNEGAAAARGEILFRMDADDLMFRSRVDRQVDYLLEHPDVDVVASRAVMIDVDDNIVGLFREHSMASTAVDVLKHVRVTHPTVAARTRCFRENPYDVRFLRAQDKELWVRTFDRTSIVRLDEPLLFYRVALAGTREQYVVTKRADREIARLHASAFPSTRGVKAYTAATYLKQAAHLLFAASGLEERYNRRRAAPMTAKAREEIKAQLDAVLEPARLLDPGTRHLDLS